MVETLVTLPEDLRAAEDGADLAIINAHADELNAEAEDALTYQALA
jgi:hypothetical protein